MKRIEKIKQMNIDELANFFFNGWLGFFTESNNICVDVCDKYPTTDDRCLICIKNWLDKDSE